MLYRVRQFQRGVDRQHLPAELAGSPQRGARRLRICDIDREFILGGLRVVTQQVQCGIESDAKRVAPAFENYTAALAEDGMLRAVILRQGEDRFQPLLDESKYFGANAERALTAGMAPWHAFGRDDNVQRTLQRIDVDRRLAQRCERTQCR